MKAWLKSTGGTDQIESFISMDYVTELEIVKVGQSWTVRATVVYGNKTSQPIVTPFFDERHQAVDAAQSLIYGLDV